MKNLTNQLMICVALLSFSLPISASASSFGLGPSLGLGVTSVSSTPDLGFSAGTGLVVGAQADFELQNGFYLHPELRLNSKKANYSTTVAGVAVTANVTVSYFEFPFLGKFRSQQDQVGLFGLFGPVVGFKTGDGLDVTVDGATTTVDTSGLGFSYNGVNFGLEFGGGLDTELDEGLTGSFSLRYHLGLLDIVDVDAQTVTLNTFLILAGLSWNIDLN